MKTHESWKYSMYAILQNTHSQCLTIIWLAVISGSICQRQVTQINVLFEGFSVLFFVFFNLFSLL